MVIKILFYYCFRKFSNFLPPFFVFSYFFVNAFESNSRIPHDIKDRNKKVVKQFSKTSARKERNIFQIENSKERSDHSNRRIGLIKMKARRNYLILIFPEWTGRIIRKIITTKLTIHEEEEVSPRVYLSFFLPFFLSIFPLPSPPCSSSPPPYFQPYFCNFNYHVFPAIPADFPACTYVYTCTRLPI